MQVALSLLLHALPAAAQKPAPIAARRRMAALLDALRETGPR
jgi:hypothetical protein